MRKTAALLLLLTLALAGCSSNDTAGRPTPSPKTTTSAPTTTTTTTPPAVANDTTLTACRGFAEDPAVDLMRDTVASSVATADARDVADAFDTLLDLEQVAVTKGLDPGVAEAMTFVSESAAAQRASWVDTGTLPPIPFQRLLSAVDDACETAGVDMA